MSFTYTMNNGAAASHKAPTCGMINQKIPNTANVIHRVIKQLSEDMLLQNIFIPSRNLLRKCFD